MKRQHLFVFGLMLAMFAIVLGAPTPPARISAGVAMARDMLPGILVG